MAKLSESDKATRYIAQLDEARCAGRWGDVPELCRKVEKHASHRPCLVLAARSEAQISAYSNQRPPTAASTTSSGLSKIIPSLLTAIEENGDNVQDAFQATICLGWLHYVLEEPGLAVARLPKDFWSIASDLSGQGEYLSGWTRVCIIKGAFLKGSAQDKTGAVSDAIQTYRSVLPWLSSVDISSESLLFKSWTERLLVRLCQLVDQTTETGEYLEPSEALQAFRLWARFCESTGATGGAEIMVRHRRSAWKAYYATLSIILQNDIPYELGPEVTAATGKTNAKLPQRTELKRVEVIYENLLLKETHFPKASDGNQEIEEWADAVMLNWRVLCGPTWGDDDLGEGGKEAVGRGVLDILYRAATKTFHSTAILRHLFTVHASLAEFDLAFKAYDSYVDIINRGKDRAEKSGEEDAGIDDDSVVLYTSAEAIRLLCRFGSRKEAEKALEIGGHIEKWLEQTQHIKANTSEAGSLRSYEATIAPDALAAAYCAIGIAQAQWARFTYDADARTAIQTKAVQYLRRSLEPRFEAPHCVEALYALGLVLADMRDIAGAVKVLKRALSSASRDQGARRTDEAVPRGLRAEFVRERKLLPLWHLLALLLSARFEFPAAEKSCEAAFEQFGDPTILFGREEEDTAYRSEHLNDANGKGFGKSATGVVDQMGTFERMGILHVKMTQLSLVEVLEGPEVAVDGCDELLALYGRLFGPDQSTEATKIHPETVTLSPPKSAVGTIRGSIFRSRSSAARSGNKETIVRNSSITSSRPSTVATHTTVAPTIQVTDETGADSGKAHHHHLFHHKHEQDRPGVTRTSSKLQKRSANSLSRRSTRDPTPTTEAPDLEDRTNGSPVHPSAVQNRSRRQPSISSSLRKSLESNEGPSRHVGHNISQSKDMHLSDPPQKMPRLSAPFANSHYIPPDPCFPGILIRRHKVTLLVTIWIFISGLYTHAGMYEDAKGAVGEALKLVDTFEAQVAQETSSSSAFSNRGWGGGQSVENLWATAFAARGELLSAQNLKHEAKADFERALLHYPDHPKAIVGLSNILLDIYSQNIPLEPIDSAGLPNPRPVPPAPDANRETNKQHILSHTPSAENQIDPPELNRLAARDRAFGLLSTLTKLGSGWDYSEAWYALARAYEESGQVEKAKDVLWWCVELEDSHPVRSWKLALNGFVL